MNKIIKMIPIDDDGLDVAAFATALDRTGRAPKFLYTAPNVSEPNRASR